MRFSYNWLRELVPGLELNPSELGELITMKTAECESVEPVGEHLRAVCVARVVAAEPIPGSKNLKVQLDTGRYGQKTVVCGAPNCRPGMLSAYVPPGVMLQGRELRVVEIDGVRSEGMLASGAELGINRDASGILELDGARPGDSIPGCEPDFILTIDNKSITHRPDLWGHVGLAREIAAILGLELRDPVELALLPAPAVSPIDVHIENFDLCPRYSALAFENVSVRPSPLWLQYRLECIGMNAINNIVDVTNYIAAELAQPMHAFDWDTLHGNVIVVRSARPGESVTALNGETYALDPADLVIADRDRPVAIAGVIGGLDTGVSGSTRRIVLESANFKATAIRRTSSRLKLRTDASMRFEKAQDPENTVRGLARAIQLLAQVSPSARLVGGLVDVKGPLPAPPRIELPLDWLQRKLGRPVQTAEVVRILRALAFQVEGPRDNTLIVVPPSWRATRDVSIKDDLVEEVGRVLGYDTIEPRAPLIPSAVPPDFPARRHHRWVRQVAVLQGFTEVYNYSFYSERAARLFELDPEAHLHILNPIAVDLNLMRMSLLPGVYKNILDNARHFDAFRIFEIGYEIHKRPDQLPDEIDHFAAAIYERSSDGVANLFELKRLAECLMPGCRVEPAEARSYEHPTRAYWILWQEQKLGRLFEFHPKLIEEGRAAALDLNLRLMRELQPPPKRYQPPRRFPASAFDLSIVTDGRELAGRVKELLERLACEIAPAVESVTFLRQYAGPPLPEGKKSLSYRIVVYAPDHTLSAEEVAEVRQRMIQGVQAAGYQLRL